MPILSAAATYAAAIERARLALVEKGLLAESQDVILTTDLTEAEYSGGSVALGAAIAIHGAASKRHVDPYAAFTGDINLRDGRWVLQGVEGIKNKLQAALGAGCRRVFIPLENEPDVPSELKERIQVIYAQDIIHVLQHLVLPLDASRADSAETRKISIIEAICNTRGWQLSDARPIQDGLQFTISPPSPPEMKVNIYRTGAHSPKRSDRPEFQQLLEALSDVDIPAIPLRAVQETFIIKQHALRAQIREGLTTLSPSEVLDEIHCEYYFRFDEARENLVVKQFASGKFQVQGFAGPLYRRVLDVVIPNYNLQHPNSALNIDDYLLVAGSTSSVPGLSSVARREPSVPFPHIGTDESGKGDYFGPMVVAAVWVDEPTHVKLESLGVRDSKVLSDQKCRELAGAIRDLCRGKYEEVEILPERYNALYEQFKREKKNLNHLLAWGHARALESLLARRDSQHAVADQFGDEKYIQSKLMEKGKTLQLVQTPKAERYISVAAASVLARDRFLQRLEQLGQPFGVILPKGASQSVVELARDIVARAGPEGLRKVAKLHFKTTSLVLQQTKGA